ncbi:DUF72 domain-containing protein [Deinococcus sonorensis]|uniref:DUF72 domain-containing protein n=2 Tax=Deinococcus sonorensis TaxID=309891 RepID=A0AAU7U6Z2_9DEIO
MTASTVFIGCAGWSVSSGQRSRFGAGRSVLEVYATRLNAVEINSSFYRPHRQSTYRRWSESVPDDFRFSVKLPKSITHVARLQGRPDLLAAFLGEVSGLGAKLGCLLVQLPPSLAFDSDVARTFFQALQERTSAPVVCEPRHPTWFTPEAGELLAALGVGRVAADPAITTRAAVPGGTLEPVYYRWHGSPKIYSSSYGQEALQALARTLQEHAARRTWVIFDNTASGAAVDNALALQHLMGGLGSAGADMPRSP